MYKSPLFTRLISPEKAYPERHFSAVPFAPAFFLFHSHAYMYFQPPFLLWLPSLPPSLHHHTYTNLLPPSLPPSLTLPPSTPPSDHASPLNSPDGPSTPPSPSLPPSLPIPPLTKHTFLPPFLFQFLRWPRRGRGGGADGRAPCRELVAGPPLLTSAEASRHGWWRGREGGREG